MKFIKTAMIGAASFAACGLLANGQTVVRFTGSTAFRAVVHNALLSSSGSTKIWDSAPAYGYNGTSGVSGANSSEFTGTIGGTTVYIKCAWAGSEAGIQTVDQNGTGLAIYFVDPSNNGQPTVGGVATALSTSGIPNLDDSTVAANQSAHPSYFEHTVPDLAFCDSFQSTSQFYTTGTRKYQGSTYPVLTAPTATGNVLANGVIGVIPFEFVASHGSTITNITGQLARTLLAIGSTSRGQFLGNSTDQTNVTIIGRDPDSGTRVVTLSETGYGALTAAQQSYPLNGSGAIISATDSTIASLELVPVSTVDGITEAAGNGGYNSGGSLSKAICGNTAAVGDLITYLGASDGNNALNAVTTKFSDYPAVALSYNGVAPSASNIINGTYTFWSYEHMYYRNGSPVASTINTVAQAIANTPTPTVTISGALPGNIATGDMIVNRFTDGATVNLN